MTKPINISSQQNELQELNVPFGDTLNLELKKHTTSSFLIFNDSMNLSVNVKEDSTLYLGYIQQGEGRNTESLIEVNLDRNSNAEIAILQINGTNLAIKEIINLNGEGSSATNIGVVKGVEEQKLAMNTLMSHNVPHTTGDNIIQSIALDSSKLEYRGLLKVHKDAQITNTYLQHNTLILGEHAYSNSIPSLEIKANDVKASHGATTGYIDETQIMYLQSRGISKEEARQMIISAFFEKVLSKINNKDIRKKFTELLNKEG